MTEAVRSTLEKPPISHNLLGQRLGRKGRDTRERILATVERLLEDDAADTPISLSAVAREASLGMTTLYLYFSDLTELLLAVLEPIMASAETSYMAQAAERWPDEDLGRCCLDLVVAFHAFWQKHTRILHLRNSMADARDERMMRQRIFGSQPMLDLLVRQMDADPSDRDAPAVAMATVLLTGLERLMTVSTDAYVSGFTQMGSSAQFQSRLEAQARVLELAIRDCRRLAHANAARCD